MDQDYVTGAEFGRFRSDFSAYQAREAALLDAMEHRIVGHIDDSVGAVVDQLKELNGRTRRNSEAIVKLDAQVLAISTRSCGQLATHHAALAELATSASADEPGARRPIHRDARTYIGAGISAAVVTLLYEIAQLVHKYAAGM